MGYTHIKEIPDSITKLTSLQSLDLSHTLINDIPDNITKLISLQSLDLKATQINKIPDSIANLASLKVLNFGETQISKIPNSITKIISLQSLDLSFTKIKEIPNSITNLTSLQHLNLKCTKIKEIPDCITKLAFLQSLDLSYTQINKFQQVLLKLLLPIKDFILNGIKGIGVENLNFENLPPEVLKRGRKFIEKYFNEKKERINEFKIIFIGDGAAGKTSLIRALKGEKFNKHESKTLGITITNHEFNVNNETYTAHMCDFGGQEIMHSTHKFFLSERCLYVLIKEARKDINVEYWLKHIESLGE